MASAQISRYIHMDNVFPGNLETLGVSVTFPANTVFFHAGSIPQYCYYVKSGLVVSFDLDAQGTERDYHLLESNNLIGEAFIYQPIPLPVSFRTVCECNIIQIPIENLRSEILKDPALSLFVQSSLAQKFILSSEEWRNTSGHDTTWRLCNLLLSFASHDGKLRSDGSVCIQSPVSQQQMATLLSINRITVVRIMKTLKEAQIVKMRKKRYIVYPEALHSYMEQQLSFDASQASS